VNADLLALAAAALLLVVTAYLAALETVLSRLNVVRALRLAEEERRGADACCGSPSTGCRAERAARRHRRGQGHPRRDRRGPGMASPR
jgi:hypothetical protein